MAQHTGVQVEELLRGLQARMGSLHTERLSWWQHWVQLAEYILPRRHTFLTGADTKKSSKGSAINGKIINSTGTDAARNCASGIMSGVSSPSRPWFRLTVNDPDLQGDTDVQTWADEVTKRMLRVMSGSGYYTAKATQYLDLVVFGTAPMIIYEDPEAVVRFFVPAAGEYYCAADQNFAVGTLGRKFNMTLQQLAAEFGKENLPPNVRQRLDNAASPAVLDDSYSVYHLIEPNKDYSSAPLWAGKFGLSRSFKYREVLWIDGETDTALRIGGFHDKPFSCPRWDVQGNDAYGRSPAMDALGDIKQLQQEEKRKAQALDKMVDPPMVADANMKNEPASLLPGAITYVARLDGGAGFKPAYQVQMPIGELKQDIEKVEARIRSTFFNDLFMMISQLQTVRSATEIDARREEKLVLLGPVLDRNQQEGLTPDIARIYKIMSRQGLLPPPPDVMQGRPVKIEYISPLADLQRASAATAIERLLGFAGTVAAARPEVLDKIDTDAAIDEMVEILRVPPKLLVAAMKLKAIRDGRNQQAQQQAQMQVGAEAVGAGKVLSETDVGGGQNALSMMLNGGP